MVRRNLGWREAIARLASSTFSRWERGLFGAIGDCGARRGLLGAAAAIALCALAGCGARELAPSVPVRVEVPVAAPVYCSVPAMEKPALPLAALGNVSSPADTIRAYAESVAILKGAVVQRDLVLAGCAPPQAHGSEKGSGTGE